MKYFYILLLIFNPLNLFANIAIERSCQNLIKALELNTGAYNKCLFSKVGEKYTAEELANIHHYETKLIRNSRGQLIQPEGITVPEDHSITFLDNGVSRTETQITSFTFLENEIRLNDNKRNINILKQEFLTLFLENISDIMEYKPSRQLVSNKLKKTENPRIISP